MDAGVVGKVSRAGLGRAECAGAHGDPDAIRCPSELEIPICRDVLKYLLWQRMGSATEWHRPAVTRALAHLQWRGRSYVEPRVIGDVDRPHDASRGRVHWFVSTTTNCADMEGRVAGKIGWLGANRARRIALWQPSAPTTVVSNGPMSYTVSVPRCLPARAFAVLFPTQGGQMATKTVYQSDPMAGSTSLRHRLTRLASPQVCSIFPSAPTKRPACSTGRRGRSVESLVSLAVEDHRGETFYLVRTGRRTRWAAAWRSMVSQRVTPVGGKVPAWLRP